MRRPAVIVAGAALAMLAAPSPAAADVIFDPADAEELAATLDEAYQEQQVCYGWRVDVDNVGSQELSVGSNFGAGESVEDHSSECDESVVFQASITWTSETSEVEDSASYWVSSEPSSGPSTADLDSLEIISTDGLVGENVDVDVYKAVTALPLLAADTGLADPLEASPAPTSAAAGAQPTNSPGSDFWRRAGGAIMWSAIMLLAAAAVTWWALATRRTSGRSVRRRAATAPAEQVPAYVPPDWSTPPSYELPGKEPNEPTPPDSPTPPGSPEPSTEAGPESEPGASAADAGGRGDGETPPDQEPGTGTDRQSRPEG